MYLTLHVVMQAVRIAIVLVLNGITPQQSTAVYSYSNGKDFLSSFCYANVTRSCVFHITLFTILHKTLTKSINKIMILKICGT